MIEDKDFEELTGVVMGTKKSVLEGGGRNKDGLTHQSKANSDKLDRLAEKLDNGIQLRIGWRDWLKVGGFIVTLVGGIKVF